jgi:hypothetical protein
MLAIAAAACQQPKRVTTKQQAANGPQVRATVVAIRTTIQPSNKTYDHSLMIANKRARSGDEVDSWRLFDLDKKTVTYVDDVAKTYRNASFAEAEKQHRAAYALPAAAELPRAQWLASGAKRTVAGVEATQALVKMGSYQRELWIGRHPQIPDELFAIMRATEPAPSPTANVARAVDDALLELRGFPMLDHAELPFGDKKMVVEHTVLRVEQKDVPATWFNVPGAYQDVTPRPKAPAASRRRAS